MYSYRAFGLSIQSEIEFLELQYCTYPEKEPDVRIVKGRAPDGIEDPAVTGVLFQADAENFLFRIRDVAAYHVENGSRITVDACEGAEEGLVRAFLLGAVMGALLYQRGYFLLHGSAVDTDHGAVLFCGRSGTGKSTLAAVFEREGYPILTDDLSAIKHDDQGDLVLYPGYPQLKLWQETLDLMNLSKDDVDGIRQINKARLKFAVPKPDRYRDEPRPVSHIFILGIHNKQEFVKKQVTGMDKVRRMRKQLHSARFVRAGINRDNHFRLMSEAANTVRLFTIIRPQKGSLDELFALIEEELER